MAEFWRETLKVKFRQELLKGEKSAKKVHVHTHSSGFKRVWSCSEIMWVARAWRFQPIPGSSSAEARLGLSTD